MTMDIRPRFVNRVALLDLKGRLTVGPADAEVEALRSAIADVVSGGCLDIALNLAGLTHLDARGLGELVLALQTVRRRGGRLTLVAPPPRIAKMLAVTGLATVFDRCDSEAELSATLGSFGSFGSFGRSDRSDSAALAIGGEPLSSAISV